MTYISSILGSFLKLIYDMLVSVLPSEPESVSFYALAIIIATIIIKAAVLPVNLHMIKSQKKMAELQPEIEKLKKKYKNDPQTMAVKQQQLFKDANYNALSGCLPMIIQMVVLIAFYRVFLSPEIYAFTDKVAFEAMNKNFFHMDSLSNVDTTLILPVLAAFTTFLTSYITTKNPATQATQNAQTKSMTTSMMIVMPVLIFWMSRNFQSALTLYWTVSNTFTVIQQFITNKMIAKEVAEELQQ
ncbi:YidC/Oxa1 family membrane protein insertase [Peptoniphilus equinus]|uniref:YidC/Oxa1 family membrane protein insertase n=1 Tax=Peptoniphilus equinus TaxID=3016343 RepID=A0ABY7QT78_9FIRM|nr:YidC/Oxa1 family membrane protein insertase [Peptoniphilus equinus]WBW49982.1 YidC/Oxa1 family membrane protein insertase [Peptoniphilus equinus]